MGMMSEGTLHCRRRPAFRRALRRYPLVLSFLVLGAVYVFLLAVITGKALGKQADTGLIFHEKFEVNSKGKKRNAPLVLKGGAIHEGGKSGSGLYLTKNDRAELKLPTDFSARSGTISFWVKPLWAGDDSESHTFLTLRWNDGKQSYLSISQGWWEPTGKGRLYFILSNQEFVHCSLPYALDTQYWSKITVTWKAGRDGYCRMYLDGEKLAEHRGAFSGEYGPAGPLYLGSDAGSTQSANRKSDFIIDDLVINSRPLSDAEVLSSFEAESDVVCLERKRWRWLDEVEKIPLAVRRDQSGALLERRVIFDEDVHWALSRLNTDRILSRISSAGFNVYIPCVWHGRGSYYPTPLAHQDERVRKRIASGDDPLAYLIKRAHEKGIEVHPWFTVVRREDDVNSRLFDSGSPEGAYNAQLPAFREFIVSLMLDVVKRYDVDGINLDYIRTMGICVSSYCQQSYRESFGADLLSDLQHSTVKGSARDRLQKWQDDAIGSIIGPFASRARSMKPLLVVSTDGHPAPKGATRPLDGRDDVGWLERNQVDAVFAMDYRRKVDVEGIDSLRAGLVRPESLSVLFANYDRIGGRAVSRSGAVVAGMAEYARRRWPGGGVGFYLYNMLTDEQIRALRSGPFKEPAKPFWHGD
ncbi:hypothetical protein RW64_16655 [Geobacter sulfurreducens]|nr:hypothetical protein RW64_16655 [Geobacter sulfurreducens]